MSQIADSAHLKVPSFSSSDAKSPASLPWIERLVSIHGSRNPNFGLIETVRDEWRHHAVGSYGLVPVDGQDWQATLSSPKCADGLLYGRGSCDMKGFIGAALTMLPQMQATKLAKPIHFALSYDEEVGCAGAPLMISDLKKRAVWIRTAALSANPRRCARSSRTRASTHINAMLRARLRGAFIADAEGSERDRICGAVDLLHPRRRR